MRSWGSRSVCPGAFSPSDVTFVGFLRPFQHRRRFAVIVEYKPRLHQRVSVYIIFQEGGRFKSTAGGMCVSGAAHHTGRLGVLLEAPEKL